MKIENELLKDIIERSPNNSHWEFTYSWDKIEDIFLRKGAFNYDNKTFLAILSESNKLYFISVLDEYNLSDWIVHQNIRNQSNVLLFESFDHMEFSLISPEFPESNLILAKYSNLDFLELKKE